MTYAVSILRRAQKELQQLPREDYKRVCDAIRALAHEPRPAGCLVLTGRVGWRIHVGTYRVICNQPAGVGRSLTAPPSLRTGRETFTSSGSPEKEEVL
jgi:mRNA interferase RelE/StbE